MTNSSPGSFSDLPLSGAEHTGCRASWRPLNIVVVDEELPFPPTSGKRIRTLSLLVRLAPRHHITCVCHLGQQPEEARSAAAYLADHGITPVVVERKAPPRQGAGFYARLAANLLSPLPYSVSSHQSRALRQAVERVAREQPVDLWHCEWTPYAQTLRGGVAGPRLVMAHNVESVIWERYHQTERNPLRRWYIGQQWRKFRRFEAEVLAEASCTVAVSDLDAARLRDDLGVPQVEVVENGVDTEYFRPMGAPRDPSHLVFVGSLDWRPNQDGARCFLEQVLPALRREEPRTRFSVVGRNPPGWLTHLVARTPGAYLHANVPDVRPFLAECGVMVTPLRIGGGSRLKILEALASGAPVVSTRIGAEGLHLEPGRDLTVVEDIADLRPALLESMRRPQLAQAQAEAGRRQVLARYDWDLLADQLEQIWIQCVAGYPHITARPAPADQVSSPRRMGPQQDELPRGGHAA